MVRPPTTKSTANWKPNSGWGTWEPCHKLMLGNGIVGIENLGGDLAKVSGKRFKFYCFPMRWYMGDGSIARCIAEIDETVE